jgi:carbon starvation protein
MLLESFLGICVIAVMMIGASRLHYLQDVHPRLIDAAGKSNWILGFAAAVGNAGKLAYGVPVAVGALGGMVLLEGFLVTTLDTAIRLTRYLIEEIWRVLFDRYDIFATPAARPVEEASAPPAGGCGIPPSTPLGTDDPPAAPIRTTGTFRAFLKFLTHYWVNSGIAVGLTLLFAFSSGIMSLWGLFATSNQLLASMVLSLATLWLLRQGRRAWFVAIPAVLMLVTTAASLVLQLLKFGSGPKANTTLLVADIVLMGIAVYLFSAGIVAAVRYLRRASA